VTDPKAFVRKLGVRAVLAFALAACAAGQAAAYSFTASVTTAPDLGKVVAANTGVTTFTFSPSSGAVTQSGSATRLTSGTVRGLILITCTGTGNTCTGAIARVRIGSIGTPTGKAGALTNFTVSIAGGGTISGTSGTNPVDFTLTQTSKQTQPTIYFGADFPVNGNNGGGSAGNATSGFYVYVANSPTVPTTGTSGNATVLVDRPIAFSGTTTLEFGTIYNPTSGTSTVTLDPNAATNPVSVTGNAILGSSPTPNRATYNITGEGGQTFSTTIGSLTLSNGTDTIPVTLTNSTLPTTLSLTPGNQGTATFYVGGHFDITPSTHGHTYTGSYNVTVQYN
jgi:hypothetical protein